MYNAIFKCINDDNFRVFRKLKERQINQFKEIEKEKERIKKRQIGAIKKKKQLKNISIRK